MLILVVGVNHKRAPVEVREKLAVSSEQMEEAFELLKNYLSQGVILSTCNRTEVYSVVEKESTASERIGRFMSHLSDLPPFVISSLQYAYRGQGAVRHLFQVACGLDSMIFGEAQILGQVRHALEIAQTSSEISPPLMNLFRHAVRVGRRVRSETDIGRNAASISSASVEIARKLYGDLSSASVLVIGAGRMAKRAARILMDSGASRVIMTNRTYQRVAELSTELDIESRRFEELDSALATCDIAITATSSPDYVLPSKLVKKAMSQRQGRTLYLIDISVPRNIDPEAGKIKNVHLSDIDDLKAVSEINLEERRKEAAKVDTIIDAELAKFMVWWEALKVGPTIATLRRKTEAIRQAELTRALSKLSTLSEEDRWTLNAMTNAIVNKILHKPVTRLRENRHRDGYLRAVEELFGLNEEP